MNKHMRRKHPSQKISVSAESPDESFEDPIAEQTKQAINENYPELLENENRSKIFFNEVVSCFFVSVSRTTYFLWNPNYSKDGFEKICREAPCTIGTKRKAVAGTKRERNMLAE